MKLYNHICAHIPPTENRTIYAIENSPNRILLYTQTLTEIFFYRFGTMIQLA